MHLASLRFCSGRRHGLPEESDVNVFLPHLGQDALTWLSWRRRGRWPHPRVAQKTELFERVRMFLIHCNFVKLAFVNLVFHLS